MTGHHHDTAASHAISIHDEKASHGMIQRKHQESTASRVIKANNRATLLNLAFVFVAVLVSTAATVTVVMTRPTHTSNEDSTGGTTLRDQNGEVVATATMEEEVVLAGLPALGASSSLYSQVKRVGWTASNGAVMGFTVSGYVWYNSTDMDFFLDAGHTLHIADGDLHISEGVELPDVAGGILQRRRMNPVLWRIFVWAVRIYTVTHGSGHNGKQDDPKDKGSEAGTDTDEDGDEGGKDEGGGEEGGDGNGFHDQDGDCPPLVLCRLMRRLGFKYHA